MRGGVAGGPTGTFQQALGMAAAGGSRQPEGRRGSVNLNEGATSVPATQFPILPAPQTVHGQRAQTDQQVAAILSLPPTVLAKLARTQDLAQQQQIANSSRLDPYLPVMALPAPVGGGPILPMPEVPATPGGSFSHPGIPHILHQVFAPNTAGLLAPVSEPARSRHDFQPTYRSVDEWAIEVAHHTAANASLDAASAQGIAAHLKQWALHSQEAQVEQHVVEARANAVSLAAKAEAALQTVRTSGVAPHPQALQFDISPYAATYQDQLAQIASGYYTQLHKDAMRKLQASEATQAPSTATPAPAAPPGEKATAMNVQAAAVAALTANVMAATELANRAGEKLHSVGVPVSGSLTSALPPPGPAAIEATKHSLGMQLQQQQPQPQRSAGGTGSPANGYAPQFAQQQPGASASSAQLQKQEQVNRLLMSAEASGQCTEEARNYLLAYAHNVYSTNPHDEGLLPLLHTLAKLHPGHLPTLLLLSCVYYSAGQYELSVHYNEEILKIDPSYVRCDLLISTSDAVC